MKSIVNNDQSILETDIVIRGVEAFFPHSWTHEEFFHISCVCDNLSAEPQVRDAMVTVELLIDGKVDNTHTFIFRGGQSFHSVIKDEVFKALINLQSTSRRIRVITQILP